MRVAVVTVQVPFISGGAEFLAHGLVTHLRRRGVETDLVTLPFKWYPPKSVLDAMLAARLTDLEEVDGHSIDRLITLKFPAYYVPHSNKVLWLLHQHRQAYDLYDSPYGDLKETAIGRDAASEIKRWDKALLPNHRLSFSISKRVSERLLEYNGLDAEPLYPPPAHPETYHCLKAEPFVLAPGRMTPLKRQKLAIEAMQRVPDGMKLILIGPDEGGYAHECRDFVARQGLADRVTFLGKVSEEEKIDLFARCAIAYNGVYDEDYGYVTPEAFLSGKPVLAHVDGGGPLEFMHHGENGLVVEPEPDALAEAILTLRDNPARAKTMGRAGKASLKNKNLNWDYVVDRLLA